MNQKIVLTVLIAVACVSGTPSESREKRSNSWWPSFLGGGSTPSAEETVETADESVPYVIDNRIQSGNLPQLQPGSIGQIIGKGKVVGNKIVYPVWRVHKYQGVHVQPLPYVLEEDVTGLSLSSPDSRLPSSTPNVENWLTPELIQMAREFGVTDFSKLPSLEDTMNLLGTTTKEETIENIKEFAKDESGRQLIRDFVEGENAQDNEVAASENIENVDNNENVDELNADSTAIINQYALAPNQLIPQLATLGTASAQTEERSEAENPDAVETTTPVSFFSRVGQWVNFLNPLANREEIPIPPSANEIGETAEDASDTKIQSKDSSQQTIPIPELPSLAPLPTIPGAELPPPALPTAHIPAYVIPNYSKANNGQYVRVKLPLTGFNPTPQYTIDPKYLNYAQDQLTQQDILITHVQPRHYYHQLEASAQPTSTQVEVNQPKLTTSEPTTKVTINQPTDFNKQIYNTSKISSPKESPTEAPKLFSQSGVVASVPSQQNRVQELPNNEPQQFRAGVQSNIGTFPLEQKANYEVFKNAPKIANSYGAPALTNAFETPPNGYWVAPESKVVHIYQKYEFKPAASEIVERRIKVNEGEEPEAENDTKEEPVDEAAEESVKVKDVETAVHLTNNDKITPDANRSTENYQPDQTKVNVIVNTTSSEIDEKEKVEVGEKKEEKINAKYEPSVEKKPTIEASAHRKLRKSSRVMKTSTEKQPIITHVQRIAPQNVDNIAAERIHRADPMAVEMLPFTLRSLGTDGRS
ncbi:uncharacterized protein LOC116342515 [Contarinia nasturtii]|uniref:uncharacterized protein LOC116342515 n=1 Tax=Contarinia nasturtii TaxID=265458 RepID=UPI0012D4069B|nr:uncharacterized protein LOC116342515 [Contarinia nasturtii]